MNAEELRLEELVRFGDGLVDLHGRRLIIQDTSTLGQFRRDLIEMVGWDHARRILTRKGYFWGQTDAAGMQRLFHWEGIEAWLRAGVKLQRIWGVAAIELSSLDVDEAAGTLAMEFTCKDSREADEFLAELGTADMPCCWALMGYASGYATYCLGKSVYFVERECRAQRRCAMLRSWQGH